MKAQGQLYSREVPPTKITKLPENLEPFLGKITKLPEKNIEPFPFYIEEASHSKYYRAVKHLRKLLGLKVI